MEIKAISKEALQPIYEEHMTQDFPVDELKPWAAINALYDHGVYESYGLYEGDALLGYACLTRQADVPWMLLDYYAICAQYRSHGYGSQFITLLWEALRNAHGIFVEIERIDCAKTDDERQTRLRRRQFYLRNHLETTGVRSSLFGVAYEILYMPCAGPALDDAAKALELEKIYRTMFPPKVFEEFAEVTVTE